MSPERDSPKSPPRGAAEVFANPRPAPASVAAPEPDGIGTASRTRWKLRRAVALLNGIFTTLGLEKHPNKTFIGRVEKGFDFLGYRLWPDRIRVAQATVERFLARVTRLYEQGRGRPLGLAPLRSYVRRWMGWTGAGVPAFAVCLGTCRSPAGAAG